MGKIMKSGKVVIVLNGRYAGRKAIILKTVDEGTPENPFGQALVAGIDRYPRQVSQRMNKVKVHKNCRIKPFIKLINYNHLLPTRYTVSDLNLVPCHGVKEQKDPAKRKKARFAIRMAFEERYKNGKNRWFFQKLRF